MNKSIVKLSLISTLMLAANSAIALPNDSEKEKKAEEEMLIQTIDPDTGLVIYARCPTLPNCGSDLPPIAELDQDQQ